MDDDWSIPSIVYHKQTATTQQSTIYVERAGAGAGTALLYVGDVDRPS